MAFPVDGHEGVELFRSSLGQLTILYPLPTEVADGNGLHVRGEESQKPARKVLIQQHAQDRWP
jgi:hypothetical protein